MTTPRTIFGLFTTIRDATRAKGMPYVMEYGPAQVPVAAGNTRVVFQRDYDSPDAPQPARSQHRNPIMVGVRGSSLLVRIHAQHTAKGAQRHDHEELADQIADQVRVELHKASAAFNTIYRITRMGFVPNLDVADGWAGVTYEIRFQIDRGEFDRDWQGAAADEVEPTFVNARGDVTGSVSTVLPNATTRVS